MIFVFSATAFKAVALFFAFLIVLANYLTLSAVSKVYTTKPIFPTPNITAVFIISYLPFQFIVYFYKVFYKSRSADTAAEV